MSNIGIYFYNSLLLVFMCFLNFHCAGSKTKTSQVDTHQIRLEPIAETMQNDSDAELREVTTLSNEYSP